MKVGDLGRAGGDSVVPTSSVWSARPARTAMDSPRTSACPGDGSPWRFHPASIDKALLHAEIENSGPFLKSVRDKARKDHEFSGQR